MASSMAETVTDLTKGVYRRIYGGFITGQRINKLSIGAEAWFWRVLVSVDDFGNGRADPDLCKAATAGGRKVTTKQVSDWLREMRDVGLLRLYTVKGEHYLHVVDFEETQPAGRNGRRFKRYPGESEGIQVNPGESKKTNQNDLILENAEENSVGGNPGESRCIQNNPDFLNAPDTDTDTDTDTNYNVEPVPPFGGDLFIATLVDFEKHRREIRKPLKPTGRRQLYRQLAEMGEHQSVVSMQTSIANGWQGVFPPKGNGAVPPSEHPNAYRPGKMVL